MNTTKKKICKSKVNQSFIFISFRGGYEGENRE